jgi:hypothetical protein
VSPRDRRKRRGSAVLCVLASSRGASPRGRTKASSSAWSGIGPEPFTAIAVAGHGTAPWTRRKAVRPSGAQEKAHLGRGPEVVAGVAVAATSMR